MMDFETIYGQIVAKANHYMAVPAKGGLKRIIKDQKIRDYEKLFLSQIKIYRNRHISGRFRLVCTVWHSSIRFDLDGSLKTILDVLQYAGAVEDDKNCFHIDAEKRIDKKNPRIEFGIEELNEQKNLFK